MATWELLLAESCISVGLYHIPACGPNVILGREDVVAIWDFAWRQPCSARIAKCDAVPQNAGIGTKGCTQSP